MTSAAVVTSPVLLSGWSHPSSATVGTSHGYNPPSWFKAPAQHSRQHPITPDTSAWNIQSRPQRVKAAQPFHIWWFPCWFLLRTEAIASDAQIVPVGSCGAPALFKKKRKALIICAGVLSCISSACTWVSFFNGSGLKMPCCDTLRLP